MTISSSIPSGRYPLDVQHMRGLMDGVLLVVRQDRAAQRCEESLDFFEKSGIAVAGGILNCKTGIIGVKHRRG